MEVLPATIGTNQSAARSSAPHLKEELAGAEIGFNRGIARVCVEVDRKPIALGGREKCYRGHGTRLLLNGYALP